MKLPFNNEEDSCNYNQPNSVRLRRDSGIDEPDILSILTAKTQQLSVSDLESPASPSIISSATSNEDLEMAGREEGITKDVMDNENPLDASANLDLDITLSPPTPGPGKLTYILHFMAQQLGVFKVCPP